MLAAQRQARIHEEIRRRGAVRVSDLTSLLHVSDMTIRRDLDALARRGLVHKVHGGATLPPESSTEEPGFEAKQPQQQREKAAIAREAARLVTPGTAIGLSAGTTTWTVAHEVRNIPDLTVVTNSIQVAAVFHTGATAQSAHNVVLTGGIRTPSDALVGPVAVAALRQLHLDVVFMGAHGIDPRSGFTTPNLLEADANRAFVEAARRVVIVGDHTKWGLVGIATFARLDEADVLVTDDGLASDVRAVLVERVGQLILATVGRVEAGR